MVLGRRCGLYLAGSPGGMLLVAMLMGRDQYSLPEAVLMYSNLRRRLADVSCFSAVNSSCPLGVSEHFCEIAIVIAGLAVEASDGVSLLLQIFLGTNIINDRGRRVQSVDCATTVYEFN